MSSKLPMSAFHEQTIIEGAVYLTDFRQQPAATQQQSAQQIQQNSSRNAEVIVADIQELENSMRHLIQSNVFLAQEFEKDPDPVYSESIEENKLVLKRQQQRLRKLKELLKAIEGPHGANESDTDDSDQQQQPQQQQQQQQKQQQSSTSSMETDDGVYL